MTLDHRQQYQLSLRAIPFCLLQGWLQKVQYYLFDTQVGEGSQDVAHSLSFELPVSKGSSSSRAFREKLPIVSLRCSWFVVLLSSLARLSILRYVLYKISSSFATLREIDCSKIQAFSSSKRSTGTKQFVKNVNNTLRSLSPIRPLSFNVNDTWKLLTNLHLQNALQEGSAPANSFLYEACSDTLLKIHNHLSLQLVFLIALFHWVLAGLYVIIYSRFVASLLFSGVRFKKPASAFILSYCVGSLRFVKV